MACILELVGTNPSYPSALHQTLIVSSNQSQRLSRGALAHSLRSEGSLLNSQSRQWRKGMLKGTQRDACGRSHRGGRHHCLHLRASRNSFRKDGEDDRDRSTGGPRDEYGLYPWDPLWQSLDNNVLGNVSQQWLKKGLNLPLRSPQWVQEESVTLITTDGLLQIGGGLKLIDPSERKYVNFRRPRRFREEDYMDPKQGLCLGAIFDIVATNGLDMGRRFCVFGFCRSTEMLSDVIEDTVLEQGGEIVVAERETKGGLHEKLIMTVAMPRLWGVPPAVDTLNYAIRSGGGIVEKVYKKWEFF